MICEIQFSPDRLIVSWLRRSCIEMGLQSIERGLTRGIAPLRRYERRAHGDLYVHTRRPDKSRFVWGD